MMRNVRVPLNVILCSRMPSLTLEWIVTPKRLAEELSLTLGPKWEL